MTHSWCGLGRDDHITGFQYFLISSKVGEEFIKLLEALWEDLMIVQLGLKTVIHNNKTSRRCCLSKAIFTSKELKHY